MIGRQRLFLFALATLAAAAVISPALGAPRPADQSDVFSRAVARHSATAPVVGSTSSGAGFHWLDAGIGAAAGVVGCVALLFVAGRLIRPHRSATVH